MKSPTLSSAVIVFFVAASAFASDTRFVPAPATKVKVDGSTITIRGTSSLHAWTMEGPIINGAVEVDPALVANPSDSSWRSSDRAVAVVVSIPVASIRSEHDRMDRLMRDALKAGKHPNITYNLNTSAFGKATGDSFTVKTIGKLTIAGVTRDVTMDVAAVRGNGRRFILTGEMPIRMSDYGIKPPTAMMGTIKTGNLVTVLFRWVVEAAAK